MCEYSLQCVQVLLPLHLIRPQVNSEYRLRPMEVDLPQ